VNEQVMTHWGLLGQTARKQICLLFCSLEHAFANYDEEKNNKMNFQSKPYI
jgi:hypothetical protein